MQDGRYPAVVIRPLDNRRYVGRYPPADNRRYAGRYPGAGGKTFRGLALDL